MAVSKARQAEPYVSKPQLGSTLTSSSRAVQLLTFKSWTFFPIAVQSLLVPGPKVLCNIRQPVEGPPKGASPARKDTVLGLAVTCDHWAASALLLKMPTQL